MRRTLTGAGCALALLTACGQVRVHDRERLAQPVALREAQTISFEAPEKLLPSKVASAERGHQVYVDKCATCHGAEGKTGSPDFSHAEWIRAWHPLELRAALVGGKGHESLGFDKQLTLQEQWDALAYTRFLATTADTIRATSTALFGKNCNVCHGNKGFGNGFLAPTMQPLPRNLSDFAHWGIYRSDDEIFHNIAYGVHWSGMPPWRQVLADEDIYKIVDFIRALQYELPSTEAKPASAAEPAKAAPADASMAAPAEPAKTATPTPPAKESR